MSVFSMYTLPDVGLSTPPMMWSGVDLPEPEGPSTATNSPLSTVKLTLSVPLPGSARFRILCSGFRREGSPDRQPLSPGAQLPVLPHVECSSMTPYAVHFSMLPGAPHVPVPGTLRMLCYAPPCSRGFWMAPHARYTTGTSALNLRAESDYPVTMSLNPAVV